MRQVAALCGVSKMTVSRVLNNHPAVSAGTKRRVLKAVAELKYRKSPFVTALMTQIRSSRLPSDTQVLALVHNWPANVPLTPNLHIFRASAEAQANALGFRLDPFAFDNKAISSRRVFQILRARGVRGVIIEHLAKGGTHLSGDLDFFSMISVGNSVDSPLLHRVENDQYAEIQMTLRILFERGYRRIALVGKYSSEQMNRFRRVAGIQWAQSTLPRELELPLLLAAGDNLPSRNALRNFLTKHRPDVVLSQSLDVYEELIRLKVRVPDDVGFVHLGSHPDETRYAGISPNWRQKGIVAVKSVLSQISHNEFGVPDEPITITVRSTFHDGPTLRPAGTAGPPVTMPADWSVVPTG